jgi:hypothetical protein
LTSPLTIVFVIGDDNINLNEDIGKLLVAFVHRLLLRVFGAVYFLYGRGTAGSSKAVPDAVHCVAVSRAAARVYVESGWHVWSLEGLKSQAVCIKAHALQHVCCLSVWAVLNRRMLLPCSASQ